MGLRHGLGPPAELLSLFPPAVAHGDLLLGRARAGKFTDSELLKCVVAAQGEQRKATLPITPYDAAEVADLQIGLWVGRILGQEFDGGLHLCGRGLGITHLLKLGRRLMDRWRIITALGCGQCQLGKLSSQIVTVFCNGLDYQRAEIGYEILSIPRQAQ